MPRSRVAKKRLFRDFSFLNDRYVNFNYLKRLRQRRIECCEANDISQKFLEFMLWAYDLEFFTLKYAAEDYGVSKRHIGERWVYPLVNMGYVYKHFDKLTPSKQMEDHMFHEETKFNYRVRYALTQKGRLLVQRFYNSLS